MSVIDRIKDLFVSEEKIVWQCESCAEQFSTTVEETEPTPDSATCEACGSSTTTVKRRSA